MEFTQTLFGGLKSLTGLDFVNSQDDKKNDNVSSRSPRSSPESAQKRQRSRNQSFNRGETINGPSSGQSFQENRRNATDSTSRYTTYDPDKSESQLPDRVSKPVKPMMDQRSKKFGGSFKPQNTLNKRPFAQGGTSAKSYGTHGNKNIFGALPVGRIRGDNVTTNTVERYPMEIEEPALKRRRMTMESQPFSRKADDSEDVIYDREVIAVGGRALQSSPIRHVSSGLGRDGRRNNFQNIHSISAAQVSGLQRSLDTRNSARDIVDLDNEDALMSSPPVNINSRSGSQQGTSRQQSNGIDLSGSKTQKRRRRRKTQNASGSSDLLDGSVNGTQDTIDSDDTPNRGPINSKSQQHEIQNIREANSVARRSSSPEIRFSRYFEKIPEISREDSQSVEVRDSPPPPAQSTMVIRDCKLTQSHPTGSPFGAPGQDSRLDIQEQKHRFRDKMTQQEVKTSTPALQRLTSLPKNGIGNGKASERHESIDDSEDELNGPSTVPRPANQSAPEQLDHQTPLELLSDEEEGESLLEEEDSAEASPGAIKSKDFGRKNSMTLVSQHQATPNTKRNPRCQYIGVNKIYTKLVHREFDGHNDEIVYNDECKAFEIWIDGTAVTKPASSEPIRYTSKHFQNVNWSDDNYNLRVIVNGSTDDVSDRRILIEFGDMNSREQFMGTLRNVYKSTKFTERFGFDSNAFETRWANIKEHLRVAGQAAETNRLTDSAHIAQARSPSTVSRKRPNRVGMSAHTFSPEIDQDRFQVDPPHPSAQQPTSSGQRETYVIVDKQPTPARASARLRGKPSKVEEQPQEQRDEQIERFRSKYKIPEWKEPLTYPFVGPRRTTVNFTDLDGIDAGDLLNDNIVNFCLRKGEYEHEEHADKVFFFNTYFYSTLTKLPSGKKGLNYDAVKRWTKKVDLFSTPYVIVPINASFHWYLIIICNLQNLPRGDMLEGPQQVLGSDEEMQNGEAQESPFSPQQGEMPSRQFKRMSLDDRDIQTISKDSGDADYEIPDSEEERKKQAAYEAALVDEQENLPSSGTTKSKSTKKKSAPPVRRFSPDQPLIITLDSLGSTHSQEVRFLKEYIVAEAYEKRGLTIDPKCIQGVTAKGIPEQTNLSDCGVFLIGYVEEFLKDPRVFVEKVCSKEMDRNNDFQDFEPNEKRNEIRKSLMTFSAVQQKNKDDERESKKMAKRKATEDGEREAKRIASSPVKDSGEIQESSNDSVSGVSISSRGQDQGTMEVSNAGRQIFALDGIADYV